MSGLVYPDGERVVRHFIFGYPQPEQPNNTASFSEDDAILQSVQSFLGTSFLSPKAEISEVPVYNARWKSLALGRSMTRSRVESEMTFLSSFMGVAFLIMGGFCAIYMSNRKDRSIVGLGAVATIMLLIMTAYGLLAFCTGVPFTNLTQIFPIRRRQGHLVI